MAEKLVILKIAILQSPRELQDCYDYLPLPAVPIEQFQVGIRLKVPLGKSKRIGILLAVTNHTAVEREKLKPILEILDSTPLFSADDLALMQWASRYYHHPIGDVMATALPPPLNKGQSVHIQPLENWQLTEASFAINWDKLPEIQREILQLLKNYPQGISTKAFVNQFSHAAQSLRSMEKKGWVKAETVYADTIINSNAQLLKLNAAQQHAVDQVSEHLDQFYPCLLDGVTGSGKTEVYLHLIQQVIAQNRQALVLVPEINLTPQMVARFQQRFAVPIAVLHSKINAKERLEDWLLARDGQILIVIGTRSAVWTPLARPGIFIVDEEHDLSYKQQDHFLYSARDIAVWRAQQAQIPILLGSATPSLDTLYNAQQGRYQHLILPERAGTAVHPTFHIVDMRQQPKTGISRPLKKTIEQCLARQQQVLLFINRRGYAPTLMCYHCNWIAKCLHCDANLTYHESRQKLQCHHCGASRRVDSVCPECQQPQLHLLGQGTERIEETLQTLFSQATILRIDSDSTRQKRAMGTILEKIHSGEANILVGTQMLAKGHHFPKVTLVGIINIDGGLFSVDFRATERMAQLLLQVAGRAGRADDPGQVIVQTHYPEHPLLTLVTQQGYRAFAQWALAERQQAAFPPYQYFALLRAEGKHLNKVQDFLYSAREQALSLQISEVALWGPVTAPMERLNGRYRMQLLLQAEQRKMLHHLLRYWLPILQNINGIYWSLDVDPQDLL